MLNFSLLLLLLLNVNTGRRDLPWQVWRRAFVGGSGVRDLLTLSSGPTGARPSACQLYTPVRMALVGEGVSQSSFRFHSV